MGMFEPLTVIGLGRSPYDEVITGTGLRPQIFRTQEYDDRGRPVNDASREAVRGIIRSHNEVMQVIGAAELDSGTSSSEIDLRTQHYAYETSRGYDMRSIGAFAIDAGLWGLNGLRDRMLVWRGYGHNPLRELVQGSHLEPGHPAMKLLVAGFPTMLAFKLFRANWLQLPASNPLSHTSLRRRRPWALGLWMWVGIHTQLYVLLQRIGILPGIRFPHPLFYIPWSSMSPIPSPGLPSDFRAASIARWAGRLFLTVAPITVFFALSHLESLTQELISECLDVVLPTPESIDHLSHRPLWGRISSFFSSINPFVSSSQFDSERARRSQTPEPYAANDLPFPEALEPVTPIDEASEQQPAESASGDEPSRPPLTSLASNSPSLTNAPPDTPQVATDDYGSEEDDADLMTGPLLSFDVETSDPTDAPMGTGPWSAELRATPPNDGRGYAAPPKYLATVLTTTPQALAVRILSNLASRVTLIPVEMCALRFIVRSYLTAYPALAVAGRVPTALTDVSWATVTNLVNLDLSHFVVMVDAWALVVLMSWYLHYSTKEWRELPAEATQGWYDGATDEA